MNKIEKPVIEAKDIANVNQVEMDRDLVELAGLVAYQKLSRHKVVEVNGHDYEVKDTLYQDPTGLDALTVENLNTKEISVILWAQMQAL